MYNNYFMTEKLNSITINRVIATLFILICHTIKYYTFIPGNDQLGQLFNVGVPMFIIISGYLYGMKSKNKGRNRKILDFFKKRLIRVALPCHVWALVLFIVSRCDNLSGTIMTLLNIQGLNKIFYKFYIPGGGPYLAHTWFVTIILICYGVVPVIEIIASQVRGFHLLFCYIVCILFEFLGIDLSNFVLFFAAFLVGYTNFTVINIRKYQCLIVIIASIILRLGGHFYFDDTVFYTQIICVVTHQLIAASIIILVTHITYEAKCMKNISNNKVVVIIDNLSYEIYIVHYCLISFVYNKFNIGVATLMFAVFTCVLAFLLSKFTKIVTKIITKI